VSRKIEDFQIVRTADGSPSLSIADVAGYVEKMHHSAGALSESIYIYHAALQEVTKREWPLRVLSLGLGLGYNELLTAAEALNANVRATIYSFEIEPLLTHNFLEWILGRKSDFADLYQDIATGIQAKLQVSEADLKNFLRTSFEDGTWIVKQKFPDEAQHVSKLSCVFYDAFSNRMSPELWSEELIRTIIQRMCAESCVFATYACTGTLKRALASEGFVKVERPGFAGKRESTFAIRENQ
jgi:hypothetical protein